MHWIKLIMECIITVSYQFLINGAPSKRLRQEDPLSLYLLYFAKTSRLIFSLELKHKKELHGIKINRGSPPLNHLQFVDDGYVFFKTSVYSCKKLKEMLNEFCKLSGM